MSRRRRRSRSYSSDREYRRRRSRRDRSRERDRDVDDDFMREMAKQTKKAMPTRHKEDEGRRALEKSLGDAATVVGSFGKGGTSAAELLQQHKEVKRELSEDRKERRKRDRTRSESYGSKRRKRRRSKSDRGRSRERRRRRRFSHGPPRESDSVSSKSYESRSRSRSRRTKKRRRRSTAVASKDTNGYEDPYLAQKKRDNAMLDYFSKMDPLVQGENTPAQPAKASKSKRTKASPATNPNPAKSSSAPDQIIMMDRWGAYYPEPTSTSKAPDDKSESAPTSSENMVENQPPVAPNPPKATPPQQRAKIVMNPIGVLSVHEASPSSKSSKSSSKSGSPSAKKKSRKKRRKKLEAKVLRRLSRLDRKLGKLDLDVLNSKPVTIGAPIGLQNLGQIIDEDKKCCLLCRRKFKSLEMLKKHELQSDLHRKNIAKRRDGLI